MDTEAHPESEFPNMDNTSFASTGGSFFAGSQGFVIKNSIFNSVSHVATSDAPPDIHTITMGDIELRSQLHVDSNEWRVHEDTGIVHHERRRGCVRRVYSAKVGHHKADMTVVMFEGDRAEQVKCSESGECGYITEVLQEWAQNIATYSGLRQAHSPWCRCR
ncbi:hypothetical protein C8F04DRAFT_1127202 [Mycena alexandri]|uniref:Uncharacterized protein n=1 Tax=Mycena alexandri TaxID=1745969 RepID=A0AAD6WUH7_9AGAR|nr:hypothetical protein C8F04DRAFT_1127202 [Mycena alexandri]